MLKKDATSTGLTSLTSEGWSRMGGDSTLFGSGLYLSPILRVCVDLRHKFSCALLCVLPRELQSTSFENLGQFKEVFAKLLSLKRGQRAHHIRKL